MVILIIIILAVVILIGYVSLKQDDDQRKNATAEDKVNMAKAEIRGVYRDNIIKCYNNSELKGTPLEAYAGLMVMNETQKRMKETAIGIANRYYLPLDIVYILIDEMYRDVYDEFFEK